MQDEGECKVQRDDSTTFAKDVSAKDFLEVSKVYDKCKEGDEWSSNFLRI